MIFALANVPAGAPTLYAPGLRTQSIPLPGGCTLYNEALIILPDLREA